MCSTTIIECPNSINKLKDFISFLISWKWSPVVGSSKIKRVFSFEYPFNKKEANLILCASPPDKVDEDCPSLTYPIPTSSNAFSLIVILVWLFSWKKLYASWIVKFKISSIFLFSNFAFKTSFLNLFPLHVSHLSTISDINCISIFIDPSPLHSSHLPPSTLNEKCFGFNPKCLEVFWFENKFLISS